MTTVLLVRHAAHDYLGRAIAGRKAGVHLNAEGRAQAERLAGYLSRLPVRVVYSSPLERTRETAQPLCDRLGLPLRMLEGVLEIDFGEWTDVPFAELEGQPLWSAWNSYRSGVRIPGGELMVEVQARMVAALEEVRQRHPEGTVAVFSHGDPIKAAVLHYLGSSLDHMHRLEIDAPSVTVLELHPWGARLNGINTTPHREQ